MMSFLERKLPDLGGSALFDNKIIECVVLNIETDLTVYAVFGNGHKS